MHCLLLLTQPARSAIGARSVPSLPKVPSTPRDGSFIRNFVVAKKGGFVWGGQKHEEEGELNEKEWAEEGRRKRAD